MNTFVVVALLLIAQGHFAFPVVQQSDSNPWYVSTHPNKITQFSRATNITLLAHNYLAGENFYKLRIGNRLIVTGEDTINVYSVYAIDYYEVINTRLYQNLRTGEMLGAHDIVQRYYHDTDLTLQTCISRDGNDQWGLMFVLGKKTLLQEYPAPK